ncbi:hypothetical protein D3C78_1946040 [compost metagenome]
MVPGTAKAVDTVAAKALGRKLATAKRRVELMRGKGWPAEHGWNHDLGEVRGVVIEKEEIADRLEAARRRARL